MQRTSLRKFLIVGTQRSGSGAFAEALNCHPAIACGAEWTQRTWRKFSIVEAAFHGDFQLLPRHHAVDMALRFTPEKSVLGFRRLFRASSRWIGHPRFAPALFVDRLEAHIAWLAQHPDIHVIHLVRRDLVTWLSSKSFARAAGYSGSYPDDLRVWISIRQAMRRVRTKTWIDARLAAVARSNRYLQIPYEDFLADNQQMAHRAVAFLGCDPAALPNLSLRIPQSRGSRANVENLEELRLRLRETSRA
ncbi:MAG TPA: sulfotransferase [Steroidobacteraceae bacterium]